MMMGQLDLQGLVDIGFVVLVTVVCMKSLFRDSGNDDSKRQRWQQELHELEGTLKGLIEEAGAASSSLDRSLLKRKRELEGLLKKIESNTHSDSIEPETDRRSYAERGGVSLANEDEFPNDSWKEPRTPVQAQQAQPQQHRPSAKAQAQVKKRAVAKPEFTGTELEPLLAAANDSVSLSAEVMTASVRAEMKGKSSLYETLSDRIETEFTDQTETETYHQTSIVDPTTYRIARRLLLEGRELHVVARKVELPVSEIRLLDRLIRKEIADNASEQEVVPTNHVVSSPRPSVSRSVKPSFSKTPANDVAVDLDHAIEREVALL